MAERDVDIAIIGGGPAGMATALAALKAGLVTRIYERYSHARPAGNILNLWPPPLHALGYMGVDVQDIGAPCYTTFRNSSGTVRANVKMPKDAEGFVGLLRPDLYERMLAALPAGTVEFNRNVMSINDNGDHVRLVFADGSSVKAGVLIGADGIDSVVRKHLWGDRPKRNHDLAIIGGFTFEAAEGAELNECVIMHDRNVQGTYSTILSKGRKGHQWWVLEAWPDEKDAPADLQSHALDKARAFSGPLAQLIANTPAANLQRWAIRDHVPLKKWAKGRISLAGDAAHATSPYAAYGAGMSICDGYFIGQKLHGINLSDTTAVEAALAAYESCQREHTTGQVNQAYFLGRLFHHTPYPLTLLRDTVLDWTPFLQKVAGDTNPRDIMAQLDVMGKGIVV
ncbi:FAD-dependent urate hydroxylase [Microdochium nivale]|nr:FAD-dependent urate hydroxylase [Microdochium nivale]